MHSTASVKKITDTDKKLNTTNIRISRNTHDKLASLGKKGDTFENILLKILEKIGDLD